MPVQANLSQGQSKGWAQGPWRGKLNAEKRLVVSHQSQNGTVGSLPSRRKLLKRSGPEHDSEKAKKRGQSESQRRGGHGTGVGWDAGPVTHRACIIYYVSASATSNGRSTRSSYKIHALLLKHHSPTKMSLSTVCF